nr:odorant-binding protein 14 [Rhynchaenus maculosus]
MKLSTVVCVVFVVALAGTSLAELNKEAAKASMKRVLQAFKKCQEDEKLHVASEELENQDPDQPIPATYAPWTFCVSKELHWQDEQGKINKHYLEKLANTILGDSTKAKELLDACLVEKATSEETALFLYNCWRKNSPKPKKISTTDDNISFEF